MCTLRELLAMEPIEDQQREADPQCKSGHRAGGDSNRIEVEEAAEQRDFTEAGEHADRAHSGDDRGGHRGAQADQQQQEQDPDRDQLVLAEVGE
jgi:hypothetical protein